MKDILFIYKCIVIKIIFLTILTYPEFVHGLSQVVFESTLYNEVQLCLLFVWYSHVSLVLKEDLVELK